MNKVIILFSILLIHSEQLLAYQGGGFQSQTPDSNTTLIGKWPIGACRSVAVSGKYAYVGRNKTVDVLDVSTPGFPIHVSHVFVPEPAIGFSLDFIDGIYAADNYVYAVKGGLHIVDVTNPFSPQVVGSYDIGGVAQGVHVAGQYAYLADTHKGLIIVDVSNPAVPKGVAVYDLGSVRNVVVKGRYAYVTNTRQGLMSIVDVGDPATPKEVGVWGKFAYNGEVWEIDVSGNYAYMAGDSGLVVLDVRDPTKPVQVATFAKFNGIGLDVIVSGNYAYFSRMRGSGILSILDITNPQSLLEVGSLKLTDNAIAREIFISEKHAYLASDYVGMSIIDVENPSTPTQVGLYETTSAVVDIDVVSNYAYLVTGGDAVRILDIREPSKPTEVGDYFLLGAQKLFHSGQYIYTTSIAGQDSRLDILSIANPVDLKPVGHLVFGQYATVHNIHVAGNYAYISVEPGLIIADISDPSAPRQVGFLDGIQYPNSVFASGNHVYLTTAGLFNSGLHVVDVSNPAKPAQVAYLGMPANIWDVFVSGNYVYLSAITHTTLIVVDLSDLAMPRGVTLEVGSGGGAQAVFVSGQYAYVANRENGIYIIDVSHPLSPFLVGAYNTGGTSVEVYVAGEYVFVADGEEGVTILRNDLISTGINESQGVLSLFSLQQNYPNPFNPSTTIRYSVAKAGWVDLKIYDTLGREIRTLVNTFQNNGNYSIGFEGKTLAAGIYYYRLRVGDEFVEMRKMLLQK